MRRRWAAAGTPSHPLGARGSPRIRAALNLEPKCLFQSCIERFQKVGGAPFFLSLWQLRHYGSSAGARKVGRVPAYQIFGFEASEPVPFSGADFNFFQGIAGPFPGDSALSSDPLAPRNFLRDRIYSPEGPAAAGRCASSRAKRSDPDQGAPTAAGLDNCSPSFRCESIVSRRCDPVHPGVSDLARPWMYKGEGAWGVGHAGSCHEF